MDTTKVGRRRAHVEFDEPVQVKRKRKRETEVDNSDSVQIVGETHPVVELKSVDNHFRRGGGAHVAHSSRRTQLANGNSGAPLTSGQNHGAVSRFPTTGKDRAINGVVPRVNDTYTTAVSGFPSTPRESERMLFVQQWINTIRPDLPLWVQTSLTRVIQITNPLCYPTEEDPSVRSDGSGGANDRFARDDPSRLSTNPRDQLPGTQTPGTKHYTTHSNTYRANQSHPVGHGPTSSSTAAAAVTTSATPGILSSRFANGSLVSGGPIATSPNANSRHRTLLTGAYVTPGTTEHHHPNETTDAHEMEVNNPLAYPNASLGIMGNCEPGAGAQVADGAPVGRLFDDAETQMVVKLFRDYFTKGSCPILSEVRRRTANTVLDSRRTATSIRAKIKRLQTSGRWTDYTGI